MRDIPSVPSGLDKFTAFQRRGELRRLRRSLQPSEVLVRVLVARGPRRVGLLALTNERLMWIAGHLPWHPRRTFPLTALTRLWCLSEQGHTILTIDMHGLGLALVDVDPNEGTGFVKQSIAAAVDLGNAEVRKRGPSAPRIIDDEEQAGDSKEARLERMLARGSMTYDEYMRARQAAQGPGPDALPAPGAPWWRRW